MAERARRVHTCTTLNGNVSCGLATITLDGSAPDWAWRASAAAPLPGTGICCEAHDVAPRALGASVHIAPGIVGSEYFDRAAWRATVEVPEPRSLALCCVALAARGLLPVATPITHTDRTTLAMPCSAITLRGDDAIQPTSHTSPVVAVQIPPLATTTPTGRPHPISRPVTYPYVR